MEVSVGTILNVVAAEQSSYRMCRHLCQFVIVGARRTQLVLKHVFHFVLVGL